MRHGLRGATIATTLLLAGCGYFNTMYNAQRRFRDAQRADARGDQATARAAYVESIEKAAKSYRAHPEGRWADDALFLIGRARFRLGEYDAARAAMSRLLDSTADPELRAGAFAHLGAAQVALGMPAAGSAALDSAVAVRAAAARDPFVNLWRARGAFGTRADARGWAELERAKSAAGAVALEARLEMGDRALSTRDSARLRDALATLLADASAAFFADSVAALAHGAALVWGFPFGYSVLATGPRSSWPAEQRYRMNLARSGFAAAAGDTAVAVADASRIAGSATGATADQARFLAARWRLATVDGLEKLHEIRALLLPGVAHAGARELLGALRTLDVLLEFAGERGEPLGMFAAGEIARDSLNAPVLARGLFLTFADFAPETPWVGKALIAALHLSVEPAAADSVRARIEARPDDVYLRAVTGGTDADAFAAAEERLGRDLITLRFEAGQEAGRRDLGVTRAAARLDSIRSDSARVRRRNRTVIDTLWPRR